MVIDVYTFCWNEEVKLPYFLNLWSPICRNITIFDNGSDDNSEQIANQYDNVTWDSNTFTGNFDEFKKRDIANTCWQHNSRDADLVYIGDVDEIVYHPTGLVNYFYDSIEQGYSVFKPHAYNIISESIPTHPGNIYDHIDYVNGIRIYDKNKTHINDGYTYDKCCVFSPKQIETVYYTIGFHKSIFTGNVKVEHSSDYKMLHLKWVGLQNMITRHEHFYNTDRLDTSSGGTWKLDINNILIKFKYYLNSPELHKIIT